MCKDIHIKLNAEILDELCALRSEIQVLREDVLNIKTLDLSSDIDRLSNEVSGLRLEVSPQCRTAGCRVSKKLLDFMFELY